ncbi:MAG: beta-propeller fold lactonase family protein [Acidobacteriota bacterium]
MINKALQMLIAIGIFTIFTNAQAPHGVVYIESNVGHIAGQNAVLGYKRDAAGRLKPLGKFPTGGTGVHPIFIDLGNLAGTLGPFDSDQNIILSSDGRRLFAVNSGSDTIAVFDVQSDGDLIPVKGSPFPSGGTDPGSLGLADDDRILVVVNQDYDIARPGFDVTRRSPNHTTFRIEGNGRLMPITHSTIAAGLGGTLGPGNPLPSQALVAPNGSTVFDADSFGAEVDSFRVDNSGRLSFLETAETPASEFVPFPLLTNPLARPNVLGLIAHPTASVLYAGFVFEGRAGVYTYDERGRVRFVRSVNAGIGICWLTRNAAGTRVYAVNTLVNTVSVLDTSDPLNPVNVQDFQLAGPTVGAEQIAIDEGGEYLYVVSQRATADLPPEANALHVLRLDSDGKIAEQTDRVVVPVDPSLPQGVAAR